MRHILEQYPTQDVRLVLKATGTPDRRRYNLPTGDDIAIVIPQVAEHEPSRRDVVLYRTAQHNPAGHETVRIHELHPLYDPMAYPLLFMYGMCY